MHFGITDMEDGILSSKLTVKYYEHYLYVKGDTLETIEYTSR